MYSTEEIAVTVERILDKKPVVCYNIFILDNRNIRYDK